VTILWFDSYEPGDAGRLGGKNASLGEMTAAEMPVPPGFAITTEAYAAHIGGEVEARLAVLFEGLDPKDGAAVAKAAEGARAAVLDAAIDPTLEEAITEAYVTMGKRAGHHSLPVAVRSSATAEDLPDASFAGQQDTYLWIRGAENVVQHVRRCWASLFAYRAVAYRLERGFGQSVAMSVGVQEMVIPTASGVAFTLNPINGDRSQVAIDASWGFGEAVVSGQVTPDHYLVDKVMMEIVARTVSKKHMEFCLDGDRLIENEVEHTRALAPSLDDDQIKAVATLAKKAEKLRGSPQDVEWAATADRGVVLLQSRPETVWSRKPRKQITKGPFNLMGGVVSTLLKPLEQADENDE